MPHILPGEQHPALCAPPPQTLCYRGYLPMPPLKLLHHTAQTQRLAMNKRWMSNMGNYPAFVISSFFSLVKECSVITAVFQMLLGHCSFIMDVD